MAPVPDFSAPRFTVTTRPSKTLLPLS